MWLKIRRKKCDLEAVEEVTQAFAGGSSNWLNLLGMTIGRVFREAYLLGMVVTKGPLQRSKCQPVKPECISRKEKTRGEEVPAVFPQLKSKLYKGDV